MVLALSLTPPLATFADEEPKKPIARSLAVSLGLHAAAILAALSLHLTSPAPALPLQYTHITLDAPRLRPFLPLAPRPTVVVHRSAPPLASIPPIHRTARPFLAPAASLIANAPAIVLPAPPIEAPKAELLIADVPRLALPKPQPKTDNLSDNLAGVHPSAVPVIASPAVELPKPTRQPIAKPTPFSDATPARADPPATRPLHATTSFGDASAAPERRPAAAPESAILTAVEILSKPRPAYTAEARRLQIQGEVLLEVLFTASGEVRVTRLVRGLGHGLDEAATEAARQIRFRPATRARVTVDATAIVHIVFEIAN